MLTRWIRLAALVAAVLGVSVLALLIYEPRRLLVDTNGGLPPTTQLFTCLPQPPFKWTTDEVHCYSNEVKGYESRSLHVNVRLRTGWWWVTERWQYCNPGLIPQCCSYHAGVSFCAEFP